MEVNLLPISTSYMEVCQLEFVQNFLPALVIFVSNSELGSWNFNEEQLPCQVEPPQNPQTSIGQL